MKLDVVPAIGELEAWLRSPEVATIALNGGWELTLRDRLLFALQQVYPPLVAVSEWSVDGARADLAVLGDPTLCDRTPKLLVELKHNYCGQLPEITGASRTVWERKTSDDTLPTPTTRPSGIKRDLAKWATRDICCPVQFVHLVTRVESMDKTAERAFKYFHIEQPERTAKNLDRISFYFREIQGETGRTLAPRAYPQLSYVAESTKPYRVRCRLNFYVVDRIGCLTRACS